MSNQPARVQQCCGVCRWWIKWPSSRVMGDCEHPIPSAVVWHRVNNMERDEGVKCPCFERKEGEE